MPRESASIKDRTWELLQVNGRLLTLVSIALIILVGTTVIDNPSRWWISLVAVVGLGTLVFIFANARVFLKGLTTIFLVAIEASFAFRLGAFTDDTANGGSMWFFATILSFLLNLSLSYLIFSPKGRWGSLAFASVSTFVLTYLGALFMLPLKLLVVASFPLSAALFLFFYLVSIRHRYSRKKMPDVGMSDQLCEDITKAIAPYGWGTLTRKSRGCKSLLVWNDEVAFALAEANFERKMGLAGVGKNGSRLSYAGENVNPWLLKVVFRLSPQYGLKGLEVFPVLLDSKNGNGVDARVIALDVPDSKSKLPVGVFPAKGFHKKKDYLKMVRAIEKQYSSYATEVTPAQLYALDRRLPSTEEGKAVKSESDAA